MDSFDPFVLNFSGSFLLRNYKPAHTVHSLHHSLGILNTLALFPGVNDLSWLYVTTGLSCLNIPKDLSCFNIPADLSCLDIPADLKSDNLELPGVYPIIFLLHLLLYLRDTPFGLLTLDVLSLI